MLSPPVGGETVQHNHPVVSALHSCNVGVSECSPPAGNGAEISLSSPGNESPISNRAHSKPLPFSLPIHFFFLFAYRSACLLKHLVGVNSVAIALCENRCVGFLLMFLAVLSSLLFSCCFVPPTPPPPFLLSHPSRFL